MLSIIIELDGMYVPVWIYLSLQVVSHGSSFFSSLSLLFYSILFRNDILFCSLLFDQGIAEKPTNGRDQQVSKTTTTTSTLRMMHIHIHPSPTKLNTWSNPLIQSGTLRSLCSHVPLDWWYSQRGIRRELIGGVIRIICPKRTRSLKVFMMRRKGGNLF